MSSGLATQGGTHRHLILPYRPRNEHRSQDRGYHSRHRPKEELQNVRRVCALIKQGPTHRGTLATGLSLGAPERQALAPPEPPCHISAWDPSMVELFSLYNPPSPYTGAMLWWCRDSAPQPILPFRSHSSVAASSRTPVRPWYAPSPLVRRTTRRPRQPQSAQEYDKSAGMRRVAPCPRSAELIGILITPYRRVSVPSAHPGPWRSVNTMGSTIALIVSRATWTV